MGFRERAAWLRVLRCALFVVWLVGTVGASAQQLVTDAPVAKTGGTAYVGKYAATSVFSAGPTFHFTAPVTITSIAFDPGPGGVQELSIRSLSGCQLNTQTAAGTICDVETQIASRYPGLRFGTLRIMTTNGVFRVPVEWESIGSQVSVTPGTLSTLPSATGANALATDAGGNVYFSGNNVIRKFDASTGIVSTIAGAVGKLSVDGDGGVATAAHIGNATDVAVSPAGDVYLVSASAQATGFARKVDAGTRIISTVGTIPTATTYGGAVAVDDQGNLYTSMPGRSALTVTTGDGIAQRYLIGSSPDGSQRCNADLAFLPTTLAVSSGYVYFASGAAVYKMSADATSCHPPVLVAGTGVIDSNGDGGLATKASIGSVSGLALDAASDVYLADSTNGTVREVSAATGIISTIAGAGSRLPGVTIAAGWSSLAIDVRGNLYVLSADGGVQKIDVSGDSLSFADTKVGAISGEKTSVVTNIGNDALANALPSVTTNFVLDVATSCGVGNAAQLGVGESCVAAVDFAPESAGALSGTLALGGAVVGLTGTATSNSPSPAKGSYTVTVNPSSVSLAQGQSGTASFVFAPIGAFAGRVSLACAGLPDGVSCSFAPATLTADGSNKQQTSTLTVTTRGATGLLARRSGGENGFALASVFGLSGLVLTWMKLRRKSLLPVRLMSLLLLLVMSAAAMTGCGSGRKVSAISAAAPAVSTRVSVVTTSMADGSTQTASFMLTVK